MNKKWFDKAEEIGYVAARKIRESDSGKKSQGKRHRKKGVAVGNTETNEFSFMKKYRNCLKC